MVEMGDSFCGVNDRAAAQRDDRVRAGPHACLQRATHPDIRRMRRQVGEDAHACLHVRLHVLRVKVPQRLDGKGQRAPDAMLVERRDSSRKYVVAPEDRVLWQAVQLALIPLQGDVAVGLSLVGKSISSALKAGWRRTQRP
ncbi:hypothetical protein D3C72_1812530 [compost metagenome]